jgi:hypothetical protein
LKSSKLPISHAEVNGHSIYEIENLKAQKTCGVNIAKVIDKSVPTQMLNQDYDNSNPMVLE